MDGAPLGLVAGNGAMPQHVAATHTTAGGAVFVVALENEADAALEVYPHIRSPLGHLAAAADALLAAGCTDMVIIGGIQRPDLDKLDLDAGGQWFLQQVLAGRHAGDDQLLKIVVAYFQSRGLVVQPAEKYLGEATGRPGPQTAHPHAAHQTDIDRAIEVAGIVGEQDIGQSVAVGQMLVLGVEGPEGTDAMLARLADLAPEFLGTPQARRGVLAKLPKPQQDRRVDLPTIGRRTVELAAAAHLAGLVYETGGTLFDDFEAVVATAEAKGLFLLGLEPKG